MAHLRRRVRRVTQVHSPAPITVGTLKPLRVDGDRLISCRTDPSTRRIDEMAIYNRPLEPHAGVHALSGREGHALIPASRR